MAENEYREKDSIDEETSNRPSNKRSKEKKERKPSAAKGNFGSISTRIDSKKLKTALGSILILVSFYTFLACLSYLFTWSQDQDQVLDKSLLTYLFEKEDVPVDNWLGKFGAWTSHLFIFRWFGISSFGISFLLFISGVRVLFDVELVPVKKWFARTSVIIVWTSLLFGFFAAKINYLGGGFGYYTNEWLALSLGKFGSLSLIVVLGYVLSVILFNPDYKGLYERFFGRKEEDDTMQSTAVNSSENMLYDDIRVVNTIKDEEIEEDNVVETIHFDEEEEEDDEDFDDSELVITHKVPEPEPELESELEITASSLTEELDLSDIEDDTFSVDIVGADEELDSEDLDRLRKEYGDYDPTLDLASFVLPPIDLLKEYGNGGVTINKQELEDNKNRIVQTLSHYKIDIASIKATPGPTVTLYEIVPAPGVRISKIKNLEDDIALSLSALGIRIIAPIPGKGTIGIEVPKSNPEMVSMRSLIASEKFQNSDAELPIVIGKTISNETYTFDLTKMPHLLVAGATGQGKSVGLNAILISILYKKHPAQVKFVLVDPKKVELTLFNKIERHYLAKLPGEEDAIITDVSKVVNTLNSLCIEMDDRYELLKDASVRTIKEYNAKFIARKLNPEKGHRYLPYIVVLIDEFADLIMTAGKEVEHPIARIAQLARAIGIHLIVATQRPSVNVITGMIKANFPARIAFRVLSKIDSRTILDGSGADQLIGRGDMLISNGSELKRLQCGFVDTPEVEAICAFIGEQRAYPEALLLPEYVGEGGDGGSDIDMNEIDNMFADAARIVVMNQQGSASLLQRKLKLGYNRAGRIVDQLEGMGIIGPFQGSKAREVLFGDIESLDEFMRSKGII
jgi:S-DNA-T family DNA segregation ATPase FtsK/SpoIIIE